MEKEVLELALWTFGITSFVTSLICTFLVWTMRGQRDQTDVGRLLRWHYSALAVLSAVKGLLFVYYGSRTGGGPEWLDDASRVTFLLIGSAAAVALDVFGVLLVAAWLRVNREPLP